MTTNLMEACNQWANRPPDERFWTLQEMHDACSGWRNSAKEASIDFDLLTVRPEGRELILLGRNKEGSGARMTNWAFGQMCSRIQAPASYLQRLPVKLAAENINTGLVTMSRSQEAAKALFHTGGERPLCRAFTSDGYGRVWNSDVTQRLLTLPEHGWQVPPARPAFQDQPGTRQANSIDVLIGSSARGGGLSINVGDWIAPAGLYASDHDMFVFMVNEQNRIEDGTDGGLARGFFISNSEVGQASLKVTKFLYKFVCGNHIVWDARCVTQLRIIHTKNAETRFKSGMMVELKKYADESAAKDQDRVTRSIRYQIGDDKDAVLDALFGLRIAPRKTLALAYDDAVEHEDSYGASPRSAWGMANGLTAISQDTCFADKRMELDRAAGKVLSMAF